MKDIKPVLCFGDLHVPYHHRNTLEFLKYVQKENGCQEKVVCVGDVLDFHAMSRHITELDSPSPDDEYDKAMDYMKEFVKVFPRGVLVLGNHDCYKSDTQCLTVGGWKFIKDITVDDLVAQYNIKTQGINFVEPLHILKTYSKTLINFEGTYTNQCVTPGHDVVINGEKVKARDLIGKKINEKELPSSGYYASFGCGFELDDIRLLTWVIMDGTIVDYKKYDPKSKKIRIQFKLSHQHKIDKLRWLLDSLDIQYTFKEATMSGCNKLQPYYIRIYGDEARRINKLLDGKKLIPKSFADMNKEELDVFLSTLLDTDGSLTGKAIGWVTVRKHNVDIIQTACVLNGYAMKYEGKCGRSGFANGQTQYCTTIRVDGDYWQSVVITEEDYYDFAYCLTVPSGAFITRREGKIAISGNCIPQRQLREISVSTKVLKDLRNLYGLGKGWRVEHLCHIIRPWDVLVEHGISSTGPNGAINTAIYKRSSYVQGHVHSEAGVKYSANHDSLIFGLNTGCLCDNSALAMRYARYSKKKGVLGCGIVYSRSHATFIPMEFSHGKRNNRKFKYGKR